MSKQRGDTIVEVIVAFAIFSMLAVAGLSLMNQGTATAQRTLEITLVRQQIDAQADVLRFFNREHIAGKNSTIWTNNILKIDPTKDRGIDDSILKPFEDIAAASSCMQPESNQNAFAFDLDYLNNRNVDDVNPGSLFETTINSAVTYAKVENGNPQGLWIVPVKGDPSNNYHDFHIRACWISPGQGTPMKLGTIVRLYDGS